MGESVGGSVGGSVDGLMAGTGVGATGVGQIVDTTVVSGGHVATGQSGIEGVGHAGHGSGVGHDSWEGHSGQSSQQLLHPGHTWEPVEDPQLLGSVQ